MPSAGYVPIGRVIRPHALKGEVTVVPTGDLPFARLVGTEVWFVPPAPGGPRATRIVDVRPGPKGTLVSFDGFDSIDLAEGLRGREILARSEELPAHEALPEVFEPVGLEISDVARGDLGKVTEVIVTGANDVWVIVGPLGEVLIPVIDDVVLEVDAVRRTATVKLLAGLLDEEST